MFSRKKHHFSPPPQAANGFASESQSSTKQPRRSVCIWSERAPQSESSPSPFPRSSHTLTASVPATAAGELFLFGGFADGCASSDLYIFSAWDFSTTLLETSGEVPTARATHGAALIGNNLLICGGTTNFGEQNVPNHDLLYLLNLVSREWSRFVVNGPGPKGYHYHTTTVVGSKLFVFGGLIGGKSQNDMWALDLNSLKAEPSWELYEPASGNEKPLPRVGHVSVTTEDRIIIFGGIGDRHFYNDTWSFDISTREWTELKCTGSIPSPRGGHAAVLVDYVMYVFSGFSVDEGYLDGRLYALRLSTQRWFEFRNVGPSPRGRSAHAMASDGTRVFVLGGYSRAASVEEVSLIHFFDTKQIKFPDDPGERNAVNPNEKTTQPARKSSPGPPTEEQLLHADRLSLQTSLVEQRDAQVDMQARLRDIQARLDELLLSRDQQIGQYEKQLANVRAKLEVNESELGAVRSQLTDAEKSLTKSKAEADTLRAQIATGSVNRDEDQVTRRLTERVRAIEAEMTSKHWNEKNIEEMECRNEG